MKKVKYYYNTHTLRYEKVEDKIAQKLLKVLGFVSSTVVFAGIIVFIAYNFFDSPKEKQLKREIAHLELQYDLVDKKLDQMHKVLGSLQERDDDIYRVIFEAEPIPSSVREAGYGGIDRFKELQGYKTSELVISVSERLEKIRRQLYIQSKSYDELNHMIKNKQGMLASIPAIQPISNKDLKWVASGYGFRIDPIYKTRKMHEGIDFSAPTGTEIYATGDCEVVSVIYQNRGYGNHVIVNHGYGYKTLYGHMSKIKVKEGDKLKRGDMIGWVGSTGKSTAPHLHYEVIKDGVKVDPVNFFHNDLTPEEYEKVVELASRHSQSFD